MVDLTVTLEVGSRFKVKVVEPAEKLTKVLPAAKITVRPEPPNWTLVSVVMEVLLVAKAPWLANSKIATEITAHVLPAGLCQECLIGRIVLVT